MNKIKIITAADANFKEMIEVTVRSCESIGYDTLIYDLGGLGYGNTFNAKVSDKIGAKISSKPSIILDALDKIDADNYVAWLDADTIIWNRIDEITNLDFDIGVTVRRPKTQENDQPINAGVIFIKNSQEAHEFVKRWEMHCNKSHSDQVELNKICNVTSEDIGKTIFKNNIKIHVFPCDIYNNFYFKKPQLHAKITHYKTKHRFRWPERTTKKLPKKY